VAAVVSKFSLVKSCHGEVSAELHAATVSQ